MNIYHHNYIAFLIHVYFFVSVSRHVLLFELTPHWAKCYFRPNPWPCRFQVASFLFFNSCFSRNYQDALLHWEQRSTRYGKVKYSIGIRLTNPDR